MEMKVGKSDWLFFASCLLLGILAEEAFFRAQIGISFFVFIAGFYAVFFWRYHRSPLSHQRIGYLVLCCIWLLSASYFLNDNMLFYGLNILVIPCLVIFHLILVTSPKHFKWNQLGIIPYIFSKIFDAVKYNAAFAGMFGSVLKQGVAEDKFIVWKKVLIGVIISLPVLFIVLNLLTSADTQFKRLVGGIPEWFNVINIESIVRIVIILFCTVAFFGFMQILFNKKVLNMPSKTKLFQLDAIISITVLVLINVVYILFTIVQFKYFFSGTLEGDFTYAEYARKGFFELLFVTVMNLSITVVVLSFVNHAARLIKRLLKTLLTVLVLASSVMLTSAFMRLSMYEDAYGFTFTRVLVHSFMIFLVVIFMYTLVKVWVEKLSLFHFYFISTLIYYTAITVIDLDKTVVKENMNRYSESGKIDIYYLNDLSYTGVVGLIDLYEKDNSIQGLAGILLERKQQALTENHPWQSYNLKREQAYVKLKKLEF